MVCNLLESPNWFFVAYCFALHCHGCVIAMFLGNTSRKPKFCAVVYSVGLVRGPRALQGFVQGLLVEALGDQPPVLLGPLKMKTIPIAIVSSIFPLGLPIRCMS